VHSNDADLEGMIKILHSPKTQLYLFYASKTDDGDQTFNNSTTITLKDLE